MRREEIDIGAPVDQTHWPKGVSEITIAQLGRLGVDRENRLYWDGRPVEISRRISLSKWQTFFAIIFWIAAVAGGVGAAAQGWAAAHQWSCQANYIQFGCPPTSK